jgi:two-component system, NtrC family, sensor kinase
MKQLSVFFFFLVTTLFAQKNEADSLIQLLPSMSEDSNKVWKYEKIAGIYMYYDIEKCSQFAQNGVDLANKIGFKKGEVLCLMRIGQACNTKSEFVLAYEVLMQALKIAESINDRKGVRRILGQLTGTYRKMGDFEKALELHYKVIEMSLELNYEVANGYRGTGETYLAANKLDSALYYTQIAYVNIKKDSNSPTFLMLIQLSEINRKMGNYEKAMDLYQECLNISKKENSDVEYQVTFAEMAEYYKQKGDMDSCIFYKEKTLAIALKRNAQVTINKESDFLASYYDIIDPIKAIKYYRLETSSRDSVYKMEQYIKFQKIALAEQRRLHEIAAKKESTNNLLWRYGLLLGLLLVGLIAFILYRNNKLKLRANRQLQEQKNKIETTLKELKATQNQLIQSEKLASLGELTAGIAHEIQNPLNFVNNFSELSVDLVKDLKDEMEKPDIDKAYIGELFTDLSQNQEKINHHGKRASSIVKGMLEHSRASTGVKEMTDINALADEYFRLSYHGLRAKDKNFNATMETDFNKNLPKISIIPQDMGRVLLNLFNNAFYAVNERSQQLDASSKLTSSYTPSVFLTTELIDNQIVIKVKDNGLGMPESVRAKVFQPFFTTKPTGSGTGLGLSLAYDIVTKGHGGTLEVESTEGEGTIFKVKLPS